MAQPHHDLAHAVRRAVLSELGSTDDKGRPLPGAVKRRRAAKRIARELDRLLIWPDTLWGELAEAADGPVLLLLESVIQIGYNELRAEGHPLGSDGAQAGGDEASA